MQRSARLTLPKALCVSKPRSDMRSQEASTRSEKAKAGISRAPRLRVEEMNIIATIVSARRGKLKFPIGAFWRPIAHERLPGDGEHDMIALARRVTRAESRGGERASRRADA